MLISDWSSDVCSSDLIAIFPRNYAIAKNEPMGLFQILDDLIGMVHRHRPWGRNAQHDAQHHNASDGDGVAGFFKEGEAPLTRLASVPQAKIFARFVDGTLFALGHIRQLVNCGNCVENIVSVDRFGLISVGDGVQDYEY